MIYYWLHVIYCYIGARYFKEKVNPWETVQRKHRVTILDCEAFRYMSNSRYCFYMDFIRFDLLFRSKLYDVTFRKGILPILGSQKLIYKKPLKRGMKFTVILEMLGWKGNWAYHRHLFVHDDEVYAIGYTKVTFWQRKKSMDMSEILRQCGYQGPAVTPSENILRLFENDQQLLKL